ncbi:FecR domain-containing protein [Magnetospira sp. QH-2]|uniref:FecR domain-containing protein n=1 Tax=Magnetospira sp. (strain QH-2) TaxID=1288970 RepID=UPI0003E80B05|nr:FecR domain-containing protein [Magnetospira sp. QH-2]CCQ74532.1 putative Na-Ca exchanger/integrin-beta4 protein [Magnetospira sp. QH-2]
MATLFDAHADESLTPQLAQVGDPIGRVETTQGTVTVTHPDGTRVELSKGDAIYQGDVLETADGSGVGVVLADHSVFSLGEGGRMVMDEMIYDPDAQEGEATFSLLQGAATFVSGHIAKFGQDSMVVRTPVATIGIRGTKVMLETDGDNIQAVNLPENTLRGESIGEIVLMDPAGNMLGSINNVGGGWQWTPSVSATPSALQFSQAQVANIIQQVSAYLPQTLEEQALDALDRLQQIREQAKEAREAGDAKRAEELEQQAEDAERKAEEALEEVEANLGYEVNLLGEEEGLDDFDTAAGGQEADGESGFTGNNPEVLNRILEQLQGTNVTLDDLLLGLQGIFSNNALGNDDRDNFSDGTIVGDDGVIDYAGKVVDGYVQDAQVFMDMDGDGAWDRLAEDIDGDGHLDVFEDINENGQLDDGEDIDGDGRLDLVNEDLDGDGHLDVAEAAANLTNEQGQFYVSTGQQGILTSTGGFDTDTGLDASTMTAPSGNPNVQLTSLSTLVQNYIEANRFFDDGVLAYEPTAAEAAADISEALGLDGINVLTVDPLAAAELDVTAAMKQAAMVLNTVLLVEAAGGQDVYRALAELIDPETPQLDLTDSATVGNLLNGVSVADPGDFGIFLAAANAHIDSLSGEEFLGDLAGTNYYLQGQLLQEVSDGYRGLGGFDPANIPRIGTLGDDVLLADENGEYVDGLWDNDILYGAAGADTLVGSIGDDILDGGGDADTLIGGDGSDTLFGGDGDDTLNGGTGDDSLDGGAGSDTLDGGAGADALSGGAGDDTYYVDDAEDTTTELAGQGNDEVIASVDYSLSDNIEALTLTGTAVEGTGNDDANVLTGTANDNILNGGLGADTLDGGAGLDSLIGGAGDDTYMVDETGDTVTENAGEGTDTVKASASYTLSANVENLTLTGSSDIDGTGNADANILTGNAGANTLDGGAGLDSLIGGDGDDTYMVDETGDTVTENAGEGTDTVKASASYTLSANVENLTLTGSSDIDGTGNADANILTGNAGANTLDGGAGLDSLIGGAGDDTYMVDETGDTVTENAGEGTDTVKASASYTLSANVENLTLTGSSDIDGTGNADANILTGNAGANTISGGQGIDTITTGAGDDVIVYALNNFDDPIGETGNWDHIVDYDLALDGILFTGFATTVGGLANGVLADLSAPSSGSWTGNFFNAGSHSNFTQAIANFNAHTFGISNGSDINTTDPARDVFIYFNDTSTSEGELWYATSNAGTQSSYTQVAVFDNSISLSASEIAISLV